MRINWSYNSTKITNSGNLRYTKIYKTHQSRLRLLISTTLISESTCSNPLFPFRSNKRNHRHEHHPFFRRPLAEDDRKRLKNDEIGTRRLVRCMVTSFDHLVELTILFHVPSGVVHVFLPRLISCTLAAVPHSSTPLPVVTSLCTVYLSLHAFTVLLEIHRASRNESDHRRPRILSNSGTHASRCPSIVCRNFFI